MTLCSKLFDRDGVSNASLVFVSQRSKFGHKLTIINSCILARVETYDTDNTIEFSRSHSTDFERKRTIQGHDFGGKPQIQSASVFDQCQVSGQHLRRGVHRIGGRVFGAIPPLSIDGVGRRLERNTGVSTRRNFVNRGMCGHQRAVSHAQSRIQNSAGRRHFYYGHQHAQPCFLGSKFHVISVFTRLGGGPRRLRDAQFNLSGRVLFSTGDKIAIQSKFATHYLRQLTPHNAAFAPFCHRTRGAKS